MENTFITKLKHFGLIVCLDMQRIPSFDIAKAIALGAVIFGHCSFGGAPTSLVDFSYSFNMPTFFFISGYFCKKEPLGAGAIKKSASSLLIPYAITSALLIFLLAMRAALLPSEQVLPTVATRIVAALYGSGGVFPGMPEGVIAIGAIWYLWALFWGKILPASINETKWPGILAIVLFIVGVQTKDMIWLPLSIQPALCAVLFMLAGQKAREAGLFDKGALPPVLWVCALMTWLHCGAFYGQLYMVSNTYQHGAIDVIGGICGAAVLIKLGGLASERLPAATRFLVWTGRNTRDI